MRAKTLVGCLLLMELLAGLAGCEQDAVRRVRSGGACSAADSFRAEITFCRRVSRRSGQRLGVGHEFRIAEKSYVRAFVDFAGVEPQRIHSVHLVWIRPDGRELFRKYAEISVAPQEQGYRTSVCWLDAEDHAYRREEEQTATVPGFSLDSSLDISADRSRDLGEYRLRIYWNRELLLEAPFSVLATS
jgi:hypothetical protein